MTTATLHGHHNTISNKDKIVHVALDDALLSDYAINEIKEARNEIKRGEFHSEKEIMAKFRL